MVAEDGLEPSLLSKADYVPTGNQLIRLDKLLTKKPLGISSDATTNQMI